MLQPVFILDYKLRSLILHICSCAPYACINQRIWHLDVDIRLAVNVGKIWSAALYARSTLPPKSSSTDAFKLSKALEWQLLEETARLLRFIIL
ncbi:hypothetical protein PR202_gb27869 [Eleusine coracana subsp. coracana]|uniref:Uncharacterized protein n=1 Tax=Eleusine coracana subsp. coracana TaxID=191504 RepID=A0AAV5FVR2_ELECO|nr:hypothetical protein PR202_gb27869 [Eleusine coracana subsp. coracana]